MQRDGDDWRSRLCIEQRHAEGDVDVSSFTMHACADVGAVRLEGFAVDPPLRAACRSQERRQRRSTSPRLYIKGAYRLRSLQTDPATRYTSALHIDPDTTATKSPLLLFFLLPYTLSKMKTSQVVSVIALATASTARPSFDTVVVRDSRPAGVQVLPTNVTSTDKSGFPAAADNMESSQKAFLDKYQPLSDAALKKVSPVEGPFSSSGFCSQDFPCLSVDKAAVATIGDKEEIEREQVAGLLDQLTKSPKAKFDKVPGNVFTGLKMTHDGAVLDVIAAPGEIESNVLGGMVFDMFKLQADDISTNSIRATQAKTKGANAPLLALCLYPEGVDSQKMYQFCVGNELDGSPMRKDARSSSVAKRQEGGISGIICSIIDIPLIC